jgi:hypothetical protein
VTAKFEPVTARFSPVSTAGPGAPDLDSDAADSDAAGSDYDEPVDISQLASDDALLDALGGSDPDLSAISGDQELSALLLAWKQDIDSVSIPADLVDVDTAMAAIASGLPQQPARRRILVPLASAAAVLLIAFTLVGLGARGAHPGDALWGLTQVLYSDHARSVQAAASVQSDLAEAETALKEGRFVEARAALQQAQQALPEVKNEDGQVALKAAHDTLVTQLVTTAQLPPDQLGSLVTPTSANPEPPLPVVTTTTTTTVPTTTTTTAPPVTTETTPVTTETTPSARDLPVPGTTPGATVQGDSAQPTGQKPPT